MLDWLKNKLKEFLGKKESKEDIELELIDAGVAIEVAERIARACEEGKESLSKALDEILKEGRIQVNKKPFVIMVVGINGTGKTTTVAKLAHMFLKQGKKVVLAASDTFRAAAIEQLEEHAKRLGVEVIKHRYGADPAAVAFDAIKHAEAKGIDVVLIDTAGRLHTYAGLMEELRKIKRVAKPDLTLLVVDATTGNDAVEQAKAFAELIDGIIVTKFDVDSRGGALISVSFVSNKPIYFLGTGQGYEDLKPFKKKEIIKALVD